MDQIEMYWKCSACGTINGGLSKICGERIVKDNKIIKDPNNGCGKHQDREEWFMPDDISIHANLTGEKDIEKATCGADWFCGYCGSTQRRSDGECASCGGDKETSKEDRNGKIYDVDSDSCNVTCNHSREHNLQLRNNSLSHYESLPLIIKPKRRAIPFVIGGSAIVLFIGFVVWLLTPKYVEAKVQSVAWTGTVSVERFARVPDSGWGAPGDAEDVHLEGSRVHHYDRVLVGSHSEPYPVQVSCGQNCRSVSIPRSCTTNKNGTASCSGGGTRQECSTRYCSETKYRNVNDYRDEPRYQMWYSWYVWRWRHNRNVLSLGTDLQPKEPSEAQIALNSGCFGLERERRSEGAFSYKCVFKDENRKLQTYSPKSLQGFQQCIANRPARLKFVAGSMSIERWE